MEEWKEYKLEETTDFIAGYAFKSKDFGSYENKVVKIKDIQPPFVSIASIDGVNIHEYDISKLAKYLVYKNDFLLAMTGATIGKIGRYIYDKPVYLNQRILKFMPKVGFDSDFIYYSLISDSFQKFIINHIDSDSAQPNISANTIGKYRLYIPDITIQKKISHVLKVLDSKIELNRRINDNLEQQAQTLFKSWLVDFDPFKNGKFVESEMGMIPEGWKVISLQEYCQEITRGNIPTYVEKSNRPILNQKVNKGVSLEKQYYKYNSENVEVSISKMAHYGDVLLNSLGQGTLGRVHLYKEKLGNVIIDQFITILRTNLFVKSAYLSYTLNRPEYQTIIEGNVTGSTGMWVLTINNVRNIKIIVPKESCFLELAPIINSIYQAISNNTAEMEQLCTLRDCILPHLMSGELKINDLNC